MAAWCHHYQQKLLLRRKTTTEKKNKHFYGPMQSHILLRPQIIQELGLYINTHHSQHRQQTEGQENLNWDRVTDICYSLELLSCDVQSVFSFQLHLHKSRDFPDLKINKQIAIFEPIDDSCMRKENQTYVHLSRLGLGPLLALHLYGPRTLAADQFHTLLPMHAGFQCNQCTLALNASSVYPSLTDPSAVYITYTKYPIPVSQVKKWTYQLSLKYFSCMWHHQ